VASAIHHEGRHLQKVVVSTPEREYFRVDNLKIHGMVERADKNLAKEQHRNLREVLKLAGVKVIELKELLEKYLNDIVEIKDSFIRIGTERVEGRNLGIALVYPSPLSGYRNLLGIIGGNSIDSVRAIERLVINIIPDYIVYDPEHLHCKDGILLSGFFNRGWKK